MAVWSVAVESCKGQQELLCVHSGWTEQSDGLLGRTPVQLTSWSHVLPNNEAARCSTLASKPARRRGGLAGSGDHRWRTHLFVEPTLGWDGLQYKENSPHFPDFRHWESLDVLWLNHFCEPALVDGQLAAVDMGRVSDAPTPKASVRDDGDPGRRAGCRRGVMPETVRRLCAQGQITEAVEALGVLVDTGSDVSRSLFSIFYTVLKECMAKKDLTLGRRVHALSVKKGYESDTFLCNHILRMYASHSRLQEAKHVFKQVVKPDAFTWSAIISAHVNHGQDKQAIELYHQMRRSNVNPDGHVYVAALQACARGADLKAGQQVHADLLASGAERDLYVGNCLVDMYAKCGSLEEAQRVFDGLGQKDVVTWSSMIAGYSQQGMGQEALHLYRAMQDEGIVGLDSVTFVCVLQACASLGAPALEVGRQLHSEVRERGLQADIFVASSLVNMYAKCGSIEDARGVFNGLSEKNVVTWSAMIAGYSQQGMGQEALHLYRGMQEEGIVAPNSVTYVCLLQACASVGTPALETGKQIHAEIRERGFQADVFIANSLVNMYAKCGSLEDAQSVFDRLPHKDVVTWNAMIAAYSQIGMELEALGLYRAMQEEGIAAPDSLTFLCLLQACANVAALHLGVQLHAQIEEQGLETDLLVAGSLINMYGKGGSMVDAQKVFDTLPQRDVVTWNALIAGYTRQGDTDVVFDLFHRMREDGIQPAGVTFLSVLTACSHTGLVAEGREYFEAMSRDHGIRPTVEHYTCMVDLLGRAGQLDEALVLARTMPVPPDTAVWRTLLGGCRKWSNVDVGRHAFRKAIKLDKKDSASYILMANIYASAQMWEQAQNMQSRRMGCGACKEPGKSWWTDLDGQVHTFVVGDSKHPEVVASLKLLIVGMKEQGYLSQLNSSPNEVSDDGREEEIYVRSEKLAIA